MPAPSAKPSQPLRYLEPASGAYPLIQGKEQDPSGISLAAFWEMILRQRRWVIGITLLASALGLQRALSQSSVYQASAIFATRRGEQMLEDAERSIYWWGGDPLMTDTRMLKSRAVLKKALELLPAQVKALRKDPPRQTTEAMKGLSWSSLAGAIKPSASTEERLITVTASSPDPILAAAIANAVMRGFHTVKSEWKQEHSSAISNTLKAAIDVKRKEVQITEQAIQAEFKRLTAQGVPLQTLTAEDRGQLTVLERLSTSRETLALRYQEQRSRVEELKKKIRSVSQSVDSQNPFAANDAFSRKLQELYIEREGLQVQFTEDNSRIRILDAQIKRVTEMRKNALQDQLKSSGLSDSPLTLRLKQALAIAEVDTVALKHQLAASEKLLAERSRALLSSSNLRLPLANLKNRKEVLLKVINSLEQRMAEVTISGGGQQAAGIRVVEEAVVPTVPFKLGTMRMVVTWASVGFLFGLGLAYFFDSLSQTIKGPATVQAKLNLRTIGMLPLLTGRTDRYIDIRKPRAKLSEACGVIRNNIRYCQPDSLQRPLLITSPLPGEGKSLLSANLSISFALEGSSVLLIDGDIRRKRDDGFYQAIGLPYGETSEGLHGYLEDDELSLEDVVLQTGISALHWLPGGEVPSNPAAVLRSKRLPEILRVSAEEYDVVIVDTPALLPVADTLQMASQPCHVVMVLANDQTSINAATQATERLTHMGARLLGVILNKATGYVAGHYYGYSKYYYYEQRD